MRVRVIQPTVELASKKRGCAYARVSTESELQGESLENQITYYDNLIKSNPEYEYVGVFADRGITGTSDNRRGFQRMLKKARNGEVDLIITKSISRFARNTTIMLEVVRELRDLNVEVKFEKENISTLSGDGELMLTVLSSFAQAESENISENTKWGIRKKFSRGEIMLNTKLFLGYDKDEYGDLVINQEEAEIVRRIFSEYLAGKGVASIAKELNGEDVPTIKGGKWRGNTIIGILKNEKYKGDVHLQKTYKPDYLKGYSIKNDGVIDSYYIEGNHPPIIAEEIWEEVQEEIVRRAEFYGNNRKKTTKKYPLTGMLFCSKCGYSLRRTTLTNKQVIWRCSNYIMNGKDSCSGTKVKDEVVSALNIEEETIVEEGMKNGKKDYIYTSKNNKHQSSRKPRATEIESSSILQSINRPIRTTIQL